MITYKTALPILKLRYIPTEYKKVKITNSKDLHKKFLELFDTDTFEYKEEAIILYLNVANNTIGASYHSSGGTNSTLVDIKVILTEALKCGAAGVAFAHNHPSGQKRPSRDDDKMTQKLKEGLEQIGLRMIDHLILVPDGDYYSYCDNGKI